MSSEPELLRSAEAPITLALVAGRWKNHLGVAAVPLYLAGSVAISGVGRWIMLGQAVFMVIGHRNIGYAAPREARLRTFRTLRIDGAQRACRALGLAEPAVFDMDLDVDSAVVALRCWRSHRPAVTAVCAYNDDYAFALLAGMRNLGLEAPRDLAVIGVDNGPMAPFACPALTTVDMHTDVMAAHLAHVILDGLAGRTPPDRPRVEVFTVVVRDSA